MLINVHLKIALFISPAIDEQLEISWSGTSVEIGFPNGLKDRLLML